ncbi:dihydrolipoyl dehydrogenase family protein [Fodinibius saliphilus]|uniref:dihydrolipoyl dehydrogenase family protein n=1 Tax=Fodinibius saliphilus TaxID=1920650 RepID=UPI001108BAAC|nr:FAD-dependent oxidoreductase [Fodinibius saliphilus]
MSKYDFDAIIIGGGAAGLTASGIAANFGAKTMMVEQNRLGGDCTWTGCVPSKVLLKAGKVAQKIREASNYGLIDQEPEINFQNVIEHVHETRQKIYEDADDPVIFEDMGIEVVPGSAKFTDNHNIEIDYSDGTVREVSSRYFIICAGASALVPPIDGIDEVPYLTNESLFEIENLSEKMIIIGAGPIGTEMAQAMNRLGTQVTVIDMADRIMLNDDPELAAMLREKLESEGIIFELGVEVKKVSSKNGVTAIISSDGGLKEITGDQLLMATGRSPNINGLGLDEAGIKYSADGIEVNEKCRTNQSHIYACGDITGRYQLTHMSEHMAKMATTNALLKFPMKIDVDHVPWVTYTDPELGHVGATEKQLQLEGTSYETYRFPFSKIDRALTDSEEEGLIKIHARKWDGKIYGVSIYGAHAGELISEYALAMKNGISLRNFADTIHPYPTYGLGARRAADQWYIKNQSEWQVKLVKKIFGYRGEVPDFSDPDRIV